MTKVFPNPATNTELPAGGGNALVLTVWRKSLLFNCKGFTVFDGKGNIVFRVDNYIAGNKAEIVLMDSTGKPLLTIRRKRLSLADNWLVYDGETVVNPRYSVKKHVSLLLNSKSLAHVSSESNNKKSVMYQIEGSYAQRCCVVYDQKKRRMAEIKRKEEVGGVAFGVDVFRLVVVEPEMDPAVAMSLVILLDQMFASSPGRP